MRSAKRRGSPEGGGQGCRQVVMGEPRMLLASVPPRLAGRHPGGLTCSLL